MSVADLKAVEKRVVEDKLLRAFDLLKQNAPPEKIDDLQALVSNIREMIKGGEKVDFGEIVAELLNPRKFGFPQEVVEEFLKYIVGDEPDADSLISGTIEYAKRRLWGAKKAELGE